MVEPYLFSLDITKLAVFYKHYHWSILIIFIINEVNKKRNDKYKKYWDNVGYFRGVL
jgi:hypothetical protein